ncbi:hypothetical protein [Mesorhizobium sp. 128a]
MAKRLSALDADILRTTFQKAIKEENIPECKWGELATKLIESYTGSQVTDLELVDWMVKSERPRS